MVTMQISSFGSEILLGSRGVAQVIKVHQGADKSKAQANRRAEEESHGRIH